MQNKFKIFSGFLMSALILSTLPSCASRVTEISEPASVVLQNLGDLEYIPDDLVPLAGIDDEVNPMRVLALEVFDLCNAEREANGLVKFKWSEELFTSAMERADELNANYSHIRPDGSEFYTIFEEAGVYDGLVSENIAIGQNTAQKLVYLWMHSAENKAVILGDYEYVAIGVSECSVDSIYRGYAFAQLLYNP